MSEEDEEEPKKKKKKKKKKGSKKKKKKKKDTGPQESRIVVFFRESKNGLIEIFTSLRDPYSFKRRMSILFVLSLLSLMTVSSYAFYYFRVIRPQKYQTAEKKDIDEKAVQKIKKEITSTNLGNFLVELKPYEEVKGSFSRKGIMNVAEMQIYAQCDSKKTCEYIDTHLPKLRDQINTLFLQIRRVDLMSLHGKAKLKKLILKRINGWIPSGEVHEVYISKLIIS